MRKTHNQQLPLAEATTDHPTAKEFAQISTILDSNNSIYSLALQDLGKSENNVGANGMTGEQVVRAAIIKQIDGYTYCFWSTWHRQWGLTCNLLPPMKHTTIKMVLCLKTRG